MRLEGKTHHVIDPMFTREVRLQLCKTTCREGERVRTMEVGDGSTKDEVVEAVYCTPLMNCTMDRKSEKS